MPSKFPERTSILTGVLATVALPFSSTPLTSQENVQPVGDVYYVVERDAMTDEKHGVVLTHDDEKDVTVVWACRDGQFGTVIQLQDPALSMEMITMEDGNPEVQYRVDKADPVGLSRWLAGDDPASIGLVRQEALAFANDVKFGSTLTVRVWNAAGDRVTTKQLPIDGLSRALVKLPCFVQQE